MSEAQLNPMHHLEIHKYFEVKLFGLDISFTNSSLMMIGVSLFLCLFFWISLRKTSINPSKIQYIAELLYSFGDKISTASIGENSEKFSPFIVSLLCYIGLLNFLGIFLFSPASHISITIPMGMITCFTCVIISIKMHKFNFFSIFIPPGVPLLIKPLMFFIEFCSYISRPFSLGLRLAANIIAGHVLLAVIGSFVIGMKFFGFIPLIVVVTMAMFECLVGLLQAYIFSSLSAAYIGEAKNQNH